VTSYKCASPNCPGYPYRASERAHPVSTCGSAVPGALGALCPHGTGPARMQCPHCERERLGPDNIYPAILRKDVEDWKQRALAAEAQCDHDRETIASYERLCDELPPGVFYAAELRSRNALAELRASDRAAERAAVVRFLRAQGFAHDHSPSVWDLIEAIERGVHLKEPTT
jgi:hypothetical protein